MQPAEVMKDYINAVWLIQPPLSRHLNADEISVALFLHEGILLDTRETHLCLLAIHS